MVDFECPVEKGQLISKALTYTSCWGPVKVDTVKIPTEITDNEILIKVKAVSINPVDILLHRLSLPFIGTYKKVVGGDYSGIVVKAGKDSGYDVGDAVYGYKSVPFSVNGTFTQYTVINTKTVLHCDLIPKGMLFEQAASLTCAAETGYGALKLGITKSYNNKDTLENSLNDKQVLIIGAGTSVGSYAVEFAKKYMKAKKIVVTCSLRSITKLENLGADVIVDYTQGERKTVNEVLKFVKENGKFDVVLDCVRNEIFMNYMDAILNIDCAYSQVYGCLTMNALTSSLFELIKPSFTRFKYALLYTLGFSTHPILSYKLHHDPAFSTVVHSVWESHKLETPIDSMFRGWTDYDRAIERVGLAKASGKVVCIL